MVSYHRFALLLVAAFASITVAGETCTTLNSASGMPDHYDEDEPEGNFSYIGPNYPPGTWDIPDVIFNTATGTTWQEAWWDRDVNMHPVPSGLWIKFYMTVNIPGETYLLEVAKLPLSAIETPITGNWFKFPGTKTDVNAAATPTGTESNLWRYQADFFKVESCVQ